MPIRMLTEVHEKGEVLTGVFYVDTQKPDFTDAAEHGGRAPGDAAAGAHTSGPRGSGRDHGSARVAAAKACGARPPVARELCRMADWIRIERRQNSPLIW